MSIKTEIIEKLNYAASTPKNDFDRLLRDNREKLENMNEKDLSSLYSLRRKCERLFADIPYSYRELELLVSDGYVKGNGRVAEIVDCFESAQYIIEKR